MRDWVLGIGHQALGIRHWALGILIFFSVSFTQAQDIKVNGGFLSDSLKIGEQTAFYLSAHYPSSVNLLFPDSTFAFVPFEYQKLKYFPTKTDQGISVDSAVYYLTTFEVDRVQFLNMPVYIVQLRDCTLVQSPIDSVLITQLVATVPDSLSADKLPLKMNTAYQKVFFQFNFWIVLIALGVLLIIGVIVWIFFGQRIRQYFRARSLKKQHAQFIRSYSSNLDQLRAAFSAMTAENALSLWKKYMEQLESRPYTKLTTKETLNLIQDEHLLKNLKMIDTAVYGYNTSVYDSLDYLKRFADERFSKKLEEVAHGK
jgi:hypothetical protein